MLEQTLLNAGIGLATGVIGSFIGFTCWPWFRRRSIWGNMDVVAEPWSALGGFWCRVVNGSSFSMGKAVVYITINHSVDDIVDPPTGREAFHTRHKGIVLREGELRWAVQEAGVSPMRLDIYSGEQQPLVLGFADAEWIAILSEKGDSPARVYLTKKEYSGVLKVACMDCPAKEFRFRLDPSAKLPLTFHD